MTYIKLVLILIVTVAFAGCANTSSGNKSVAERKPVDASSQLEDNQYAIYSALINELYTRDRNKRLIIESQTSLDEFLSGPTTWNLNYVRENMQNNVTQELLDDFLVKNQQPQALNCRFDASAECVLISKDQLNALSRAGDFWIAFYEKYRAGSITTFSRVGFNREMDRALVYTGDSCGWKCGMGYYVLLARQNNTWTIKHTVNIWAS
jgi:hypothetical protein